MIYIELGLYLRVEQVAQRPHPLPLKNGFSFDVAYRALGIHSPSKPVSATSSWSMTAMKHGSSPIGIFAWSACSPNNGTCVSRLPTAQSVPRKPARQ